jgi:hypothetical protein
MREDEEINALSHFLIDEIINAAGLKKSPGLHGIFNFFLNKITTRLSNICVLTDRKIMKDGFPAATGWMASHWVREVITRGAASLPSSGPLLVVSNHVGAYDILVVPSQVDRADIKIIASGSPFFRNLPNASRHMIFVTDDPGERMTAARRGMTHLENGGALLLFGTGLVDPDPAIYPDAEAEIASWSPSIDLFLRRVPETRVVICIASGILLPKWAHSPLTWTRKVGWQKRRLAEYGQVIDQLLFPGKPKITPRITFAPPVGVDDLRGESPGDRLLPAIIARGKMVLAEHVSWIQAQAREGAHGR